MEVVRQIKRLDLEREPSLAYARDLCLFSFYTRGMSFVDMAFLKKKDFVGEHRPEQAYSAGRDQRRNGTRFGGHHPDLPHLAGFDGHRPGEPEDFE